MSAQAIARTNIIQTRNAKRKEKIEYKTSSTDDMNLMHTPPTFPPHYTDENHKGDDLHALLRLSK